MSDIKIVIASADDAGDIGKVQTQTWICSYPNLSMGITKEDIEEKTKQWSQAGDKRIIKEIQKEGAHTWVAKDRDKIVGFIAVLKSEEKNTIEAIHILPNYQGQGIGTKLLEKALEWLGNSKKVTIEVVSYNDGGIRLYKKFGFSEQGDSTDDPIQLPSGRIIPKILMVKKTRNYSSYFLGIPLPQKYQQDFEGLLTDISKISPFFKTMYPKTPHITVCYLDKQPPYDLPKIARCVSAHLDILKEIRLKISGLGYFRQDDPRVMFLNVQYPSKLQEFNKIISQTLSIYSATENNLPFHPHITVAWIGDLKAQAMFKTLELELKSKLEKVNWEFDITEVVIYGVDSTKQPEYQEKIISIPLT